MFKLVVSVYALLLSLNLPLQAQEKNIVASPEKAVITQPTSIPEATLVFYRPKRFVGSGLTPSVYVNGEQVARLDNGRFFVLPVPAGSYKIESSMKQDPLEIEVKSGKIEFFEMVILPGTWRGGGRMIPTSSSDGHQAMKKLKPLDKKWVTSEKVRFMLPIDSQTE